MESFKNMFENSLLVIVKTIWRLGFKDKKIIIVYFHTSRAYKYKRKVKIYIIEITLLQSSVQKKIVFNKIFYKITYDLH